MNSQLYGNRVDLPEEVLGYLGDCFNSVQADQSVDGYRRNIDLRKNGYVTYQQLKRMKNYFDNYEGDGKDAPFILNGAEYMKNWVNSTLTHMRDNTHSNSDEYQPDNDFEPSQEYKNVQNLNRPSVSHKNTLQKYDTAVTESLRRINQLMKKII
jgi:hypothetical protein